MTMLDTQASEQTAPLAVRLEELRDRITEIASRFDVPGLAISVLHGTEEAVLTHGIANVNSGLPVTPDTLFKIGSNTKLYTATAVMTLVEQGSVELDAPVTTYLPGLRLGPIDASRVTVRHLLSHQAGFQGDCVGSPDIDWGRDAIERFVAELVDIDQLHEPGARWSYCNSGFVVLGRLLEVVTGLSYGDAVRSLLLDPMGDVHTSFTAEEVLAWASAAGHLPDPETAEMRVTPGMVGPGAVPAGSFPYSTAGDLLQFVRLHLDGGVNAAGTRVLAEETVKQMQQPQTHVPLWGHRTSWGLGWALGALPDGTRVMGHGGAAGGQISAMEVLPDERLAIVVLTNSSGGGAAAPAIVNLVLEHLADRTLAMPVTLPDPPVKLDLTKYTGTYGDSAMKVEAQVVDEHLLITVTPTHFPGLPKPAPFSTPLVPLDRERFAVPVPGAETVLVFCDLDEDGRPQAFFSSRLHPRISG